MLLFPSLRAHRKQANRSAITGVRLAWLNPNPIYRQHSKIEIARYLIPLVFCIFPSVHILHAICSLQIANCSLRSALTLLFCFFFLTNIATDLAYIDWSNCVNTQTNCFWENWSANYWRDFLHDHGCRPTSVWQSGQRNFLCLWLSNLCKHSKQKVWRQAMV